MIVDTSALVAVVRRERGYAELLAAMTEQAGLIPAPVILEFERVTARSENRPDPKARQLLAALLDGQLKLVALTAEDGITAANANEAHGTGNGRGGPLNFGDLMVYAVALRSGRPILCTGADFVRSGIALHPASRRD